MTTQASTSSPATGEPIHTPGASPNLEETPALSQPAAPMPRVPPPAPSTPPTPMTLDAKDDTLVADGDALPARSTGAEDRRLPPPRRFLAAASWRRALAETGLLAVLLVALLPFYPGTNTSLNLLLSLMLLIGPAGCAIWLALRLRVPKQPWYRALPVEFGLGAALAVAPSAILVWLITHYARNAPNRQPEYIIVTSVICAIFVLSFTVYRVAVRLWLWWDALRRRRLQWALTHALVSVAAAGAALIGLVILALVIIFNRPTGPLYQWITVLALVGILFVSIILFVLPPSALFSYLFARSASRRIRTLAKATEQLRAGDYTTRAPVEGEDEVAQLQANFNVMAADLERGVHELRAERDNVARLLQQRREMVASVSHELRTPVATLRGYLESATLRWDDTAADRLRRDAEVMLHETERLQRLIDDLFTLAQADVRRLDLRREPVDVPALARRAVETVAPLGWNTARVEVVARIASDLPPALGDPDRIEQALHNLLRNALRHTPPGGIIVVTVERAAPPVRIAPGSEAPRSEGLALAVRDTGIGIAPEDLAHIWERFYRAEQTRALDAAGAGLGLALVKELIEAMGGAVAVESMVGQGSVFTLWLPLAGAEAEVKPRSLTL